jgi:hypothetical protein
MKKKGNGVLGESPGGVGGEILELIALERDRSEVRHSCDVDREVFNRIVSRGKAFEALEDEAARELGQLVVVDVELLQLSALNWKIKMGTNMELILRRKTKESKKGIRTFDKAEEIDRMLFPRAERCRRFRSSPRAAESWRFSL